jgi:N-acetylglucosamine kinase-like BadF-type ATPase
MIKIGFDGGGSTTRAVIIEQHGDVIKVLGRGEAGSSNYHGVGLDATRENCRKALHHALYQAEVNDSQIAGFGFGLAGACSQADIAQLRPALAPLCGDAPFVVDEDAPAAQAGAFAGGPGAILIAGTGTNCYGVNAQGEVARADGWGPLLGDRGAGYRIGEAALRAICAAHDGAGESTSLTQPCLEKLGAGSTGDLIQIVYHPQFTRDRIAALFPIVLDEAGAGDSVAQGLLEYAGLELAQTARAVLQKIGVSQVALLGGVLEHAAPVRHAFETHLRAAMADLQIVEPRYDAAVGAALLLK